MYASLCVSRFNQLVPLLYIFFSLCLHDLAHADPPYKNCSTTTANYAVDSPFQINLFNNLLPSLSSNASDSKFYKASTGNNETDTAYGLYMCLDYVTDEDCQRCVEAAAEDIKNICPNTTEATVWEESCQLRYAKENFFGHLDVTGEQWYFNKMNISDPEKFTSVVNKTLSDLTKIAAFDKSDEMYAEKEAKVGLEDGDTLYALVQCSLDLSAEDCSACLEHSIKVVSARCNFSIGARLLSRSCYLRYELYAFYEGQTGPPTAKDLKTNNQNKMLMIIIFIIVAACLSITFLGSCIYCLAMNKRTRKENNGFTSEEAHFRDIDDHLDNMKLQHQNFQQRNDPNSPRFPFMDLASIYVATNKFSESNKLGQGGFGHVYKGILSDGKEVAIKRLSSCSEQGSEEFTNEVLLIMKLQHKNLVRLLGFCVHGDEKLLVYEYMPNNSLDVILFDSNKSAQLNWSRRLNIITGIARGTLYLHEDSRLRIIHRDLKASNVLLDHDMNPKISDFGMARIFAGSEGECNTDRIVGTYGYMAPEYAMEGLYSIKSDVYSFGVLLLEIITGKRNAGFHLTRLAPSLLAYAWKLRNEGRELELIDPLLTDSCCPDEFSRYIHIGLLCVQEDAFDRPTMSSVIVMLRGETVTLNQPAQPAFCIGRFTDYDGADVNGCSVNGLTMSNISPR